MTTHEKDTFFGTYDWAKNWEDLPWAHEEPTLFLAEICRRREPGRALDIGCGAGTDSLFLAQQGWDVTSLDFMPKALEYTEQRAAAAGVTVTPVEADITDWEPPYKYDLVLDHGLLHNMDPVRYAAYRETVLQALSDNGEFVLLHWHPRYEGQTNGKMGPTRVSRDEIKAFFAPELQERFFAREEFEDLTSLVGGGMVQAYYWFRPNQACLRPVELLEQIRKTLAQHEFDYEALIKAAGDSQVESTVTDELICIMLGPGRLGLHHVQPDPDKAQQIIAEFAANVGESVVYIENLLRIFGASELANICIPDARCDVCAVSFCKRLRYR
ncbi:MAG: class I SAM-dependent methyltransferase [Gammaproteobacteria bacterium]|nr:MAG: class I SAM-dependent methyltransferase [Gammaproteobacteria bacterium]